MATDKPKAADQAAKDSPTVREPMADAPADPALAGTNTSETKDGTKQVGRETMDTAEADTEVSESTASAASEQTNADTEQVVLIKMRRDVPLHAGGPTDADVHPDEVENYQAGGWVLDA